VSPEIRAAPPGGLFLSAADHASIRRLPGRQLVRIRTEFAIGGRWREA